METETLMQFSKPVSGLLNPFSHLEFEVIFGTIMTVDRDGIQSQYRGDDESLSPPHSGEDRRADRYSGASAQIHHYQYRDNVSDDDRRFGLRVNRTRRPLLGQWARRIREVARFGRNQAKGYRLQVASCKRVPAKPVTCNL
jgi:hypothetical protein